MLENYLSEPLVQAHLRNNEPIAEEKARSRLDSKNPAYILDFHGRIVAFNLLAAWLWAVLRPGHKFVVTDYLGTNVFDLFSQNLLRVPFEKNANFFAIKSAVSKRIESIAGEEPVLAFKMALQKLMLDYPSLRTMYETADLHTIQRAWKYDLLISPPENVDSPDLLHFKTSVRIVSRQKTAPGFFAVYKPADPFTAGCIQNQYRHLKDRYDTMYSVYLNDGRHLSSKEQKDSPPELDEKFKNYSRPQPTVLLYAPKGPDSLKALEIIEQHGEIAAVFPTNESEPYAIFANMRAIGIKNITKMAEILEEGGVNIGKAVLEIRDRYPGAWPENKEYGDWMRTVQAEQRKAAREALQRILSDSDLNKPSTPATNP